MNTIVIAPTTFVDLLVEVVRNKADTPNFYGDVLTDCGPFTLNRLYYGEGHLSRIYKSSALGGGFICPADNHFSMEQALHIYNTWFDVSEPINPVDLYVYGLRFAQEASVGDSRFREVVLTHRQNGDEYAALVIDTSGQLYLVVYDGENAPKKHYVGNFDTLPDAVEKYDNTVQTQHNYSTAFSLYSEEPAEWAPLWSEKFLGEEE